jgi:hypothetical protein
LTGKAAADAALGVIKFEEATSQGAEAIDTLKEITDVYNLSAADQGHMMDLLVASHQKYSTNVGESQAALLKIGPALSAMNMGLDDGVALLNLFETAGIDASKAPMALQFAVKQLKPGQDLNDLIAQISSIVDPTERAQAAIKVFGARGGVQMAQALKPGITSLDQFATSAADTAGASTKAADAIENSWTNVVPKIVHTIEGPLAEIGQSIMPLMLVGSLFGPKVLAVVGAAAGLLGSTTGGAVVAGEAATVAAGGPAVAGAVAAQGAEVGAAAGGLGATAAGLFGAALIAGIPLAFVAAMVAAGPKVHDAVQDLYNATVGQVFGQSHLPGDAAGLLNYAYGSDKGAQQAALTAWAKWRATLPGYIGAAAGPAADAQNKVDKAAAKQLADDEAMIAQAAKDGYSGIPTAAQAAAFEANLKIQQGLDKQVSTIHSAKSAFASAWSDALDPTTRPAELAQDKWGLENEITALQKKIAAGSQSTANLERNLNVNLLAEKKAAYVKLLVEDAGYGTKAERLKKLSGLLQNQNLLDGLRSADSDTVLYWQAVMAKTQTQMDELNGILNTGGANAAAAWWAAFNAQYTGSSKTSDWWTHAPGGVVPPPTTWTKPIQAGYPYLVNENTPRSEWFVPKTAGTIVPAGGFGGGITINLGGITVGAGATVAQSHQVTQTILDDVAKGLQEQGSRYSEFRGSR